MKFVWQLSAMVAISAVASPLVLGLEGQPWLQLVAGIVMAALALLIYRFVVGRTERCPVTELAGAKSARRLGLGALIGTGLFCLVIATIAALGSYRIDGIDSPAGAVGLLGVMAMVSVGEELMFRGVLFRKVEEWTGTWIALPVTSVVFGLLHIINPNATLWGAILIALTGGAMLASAYIATRNLWVPIGLHFGWNFAQGGIFSTEVSGNETPPGLLDSATSGPELISGGVFGPEGSIFTLIFCSMLTLVFLVMAHRRGHLVARRRRDRGPVVEHTTAATHERSDVERSDAAPTERPSGHSTGVDHTEGLS